MSPVIDVVPDTDVLLCVMTNGVEIALELEKSEKGPDLTNPPATIYMKSYHTKKFIHVFTRNMILVERTTAVEYQSNLDEMKIRQALQGDRGKIVKVPVGMIPRGH